MGEGGCLRVGRRRAGESSAAGSSCCLLQLLQRQLLTYNSDTYYSRVYFESMSCVPWGGESDKRVMCLRWVRARAVEAERSV